MRIVTINGCFDILHSGHEYLIAEGKKIAEENEAKLIILLNSNSSVKRWKKSPNRRDIRGIDTKITSKKRVHITKKELILSKKNNIRININIRGIKQYRDQKGRFTKKPS